MKALYLRGFFVLCKNIYTNYLLFNTKKLYICEPIKAKGILRMLKIEQMYINDTTQVKFQLSRMHVVKRNGRERFALDKRIQEFLNYRNIPFGYDVLTGAIVIETPLIEVDFYVNVINGKG